MFLYPGQSSATKKVILRSNYSTHDPTLLLVFAIYILNLARV